MVLEVLEVVEDDEDDEDVEDELEPLLPLLLSADEVPLEPPVWLLPPLLLPPPLEPLDVLLPLFEPDLLLLAGFTDIIPLASNG